MILILYSAEGRLIQSIHEPVPAGFAEQLEQKGTAFLVVGEPGEATPDVHALYQSKWVENGQLKDRPRLPVTLDRSSLSADGQDEARLTGLPMPCDVTIEGPDGRETVTVEDGEIVLTADVAATYRISAACWPYLPWSAEVIAS